MSIKDNITPGPWDLYADSPSDSVYCDDVVGNRVANCENPMLPIEQRKANATAISKVPEMLDIIERLAKWHDYEVKGGEPDESGLTIAWEAKNLLTELNTQTEKA
jgi:hypothetical protein